MRSWLRSQREHVGRHVYHPLYGRGEIIDSRRNGREVQISFSRFTIWVSKADISFEEIEVPEECPEFPTEFAEKSGLRFRFSGGKKKRKAGDPESGQYFVPAVSVQDAGNFRNRRMIEALRLGLVAPDDIELFTFHRRDEEEQLNEAFEETNSDGGAVRVIEGEYGTGKSHFLEYSKQKALKQNYLVAKTELDIFEIQPNRPKRIYHSLMRSITAPGIKETSLSEIIQKAAKDDEIFNFFRQGDNRHEYLSKALYAARADVDPEDAVTWQDWIEGNPLVMQSAGSSINKFPSLYDYCNAGNIYSYILNGLGHLVKKIGYAGLMLLIDEAESLNMLSGYRRMTADSFFKGMIYSTLGPDLSPFMEWSLHRTQRRPLPYIYKNEPHIMLIMAFTPREAPPMVISQLPGEWLIELSEFSFDGFESLTRRLQEIYKSAYNLKYDIPEKFEADLVPLIFSLYSRDYLSLRDAIRILVEILDRIRHNRRQDASTIIEESRKILLV